MSTSKYRVMPLGPPIVSSTVAILVVPAAMMLSVASEIDLRVEPSRSHIPWKVSLIPAPSALMIWLLLAARDVMVCPNSAPTPAIVKMYMGIMAFRCWGLASRSVIVDSISLVFVYVLSVID